MTLLDPSRRNRFADRLLAWFNSDLEWFRPPAGTTQGSDDAKARKPFGELGAALRIANQAGPLRDRPVFRSLVRRWLAMAREQDVFFDLENRLDLFPGAVGLLAVHAALDDRDAAGLRRRMQRVLARGYFGRIELTAWNKLDLFYYLDAAGLEHRFENSEVLLRSSSLIAQPVLAYVTDRDLYAVTHILFDLAEFGAAEPRRLLGKDADSVSDYLHAALALSCAERHWDLVAEFLMCRLYLGDTGALDRFAMAQILAAQDERGFVPMSPRVGATSGRAMDRALFEQVYHTTVVCLFLTAADYQSERAR